MLPWTCPPILPPTVAREVGITLVAEPAVRILDVPGVVYRGLVDPPLVGLGLGWRGDNTNPAVRRFVELARRTTSE
ncbi:MAG: hypothetical protein L0K86_29425 [Actinomycetia bacterium]|nr:hypothetical protein [Actinomycetes bacterium]